MHVKQKSRCAYVATCPKRKFGGPPRFPPSCASPRAPTRFVSRGCMAAWLGKVCATRVLRGDKGQMRGKERQREYVWADASGGVASRCKGERMCMVTLWVFASGRPLGGQFEMPSPTEQSVRSSHLCGTAVHETLTPLRCPAPHATSSRQRTI